MEFIKKYSTEFIIVFFAVFLGALAENYREQNEERNQGEEYLHRLYKDLKSELPDIDKVLKVNENKKRRLLGLDSLRERVPKSPEEFEEVYNLIRDAHVWESPIFMPNKITIDQIKYTGAWDFISESQADLVTSYQISVEKISFQNEVIAHDIDHTFDMVKNTPKRIEFYEPEDFSAGDLDVLLNHIHNLYWNHLAYGRMLNRHKYFILEILSKLESEHGIKPEFKEYNRMANKISLKNMPDARGESDDDIFLLQDEDNPMIWSREVEIDKGEYRFRKGADWEISWGSDVPPNELAPSGKAIFNTADINGTIFTSFNFNLSTGKYYIELNLQDTTYTIRKIDN